MIGLTFKPVVDKADESNYNYMLGAVCTNYDGSISYSEILHDDFYSEFIAGIYDLEAAP